MKIIVLIITLLASTVSYADDKMQYCIENCMEYKEHCWDGGVYLTGEKGHYTCTKEQESKCFDVCVSKDGDHG